jgi:peptidoglycan hydrolase-like protein with peptidoglycan-binding domain
MNLQDREPIRSNASENVVLLQSELRQFGFTILDRQGFFGAITQQAVCQFQKQHRLEDTGVIDDFILKVVMR